MMILKALFLLCLISITPSLASMSMLELAEELWEKQASSAADRPLSPLPTLPSEVTHEGSFFSNSDYQVHQRIESIRKECTQGIDIALWNILIAHQTSKTIGFELPVKYLDLPEAPLAVHRSNINLEPGGIAPAPAETSFQATGNGFLVINRTDDPLYYTRLGTFQPALFSHDDDNTPELWRK